MTIILVAFIAGVLTVLAPCVLPILPVIVGGSVINGHKSRPWVIILSFAVSILFFTLLIQRLFTQFGLSRETLTKISAIILIVFGTFFLFPRLRQWLMVKTGIEQTTARAQGQTGSGVRGDIALGAVLGPVFNSCSPTYAFVLATILPANFTAGLLIILVYIFGLSLMLGLIARGGGKIVQKLKRAANPNGRFRKTIALLIIFVGVLLLFKREKKIETWIIDNGYNLDATLREIEQLPHQ